MVAAEAYVGVAVNSANNAVNSAKAAIHIKTRMLFFLLVFVIYFPPYLYNPLLFLR